MIVSLFPTENSCLNKVSVQVSEYGEKNGGCDNGTLFVVEVLFPDGKWWEVSHHRSLHEARLAASKEAAARSADLLPVTLWSDRVPLG